MECTAAERELLDALASRLDRASYHGESDISGLGPESFGECIVCTYDGLGPGGVRRGPDGQRGDARLARALKDWQDELKPADLSR